MRGQGPALVVGASGAALLLFGILASGDAATVGGVTLGVMVLGAGAMLAVETRRERRRTWGAGDEISDRTLRSIQARQDRSGEARAPRRAR